MWKEEKKISIGTAILGYKQEGFNHHVFITIFYLLIKL